MNVIETFETMISDPNIEVREFATRAQELKLYWEHGQVTEDEYKELVEDLLEMKSVNRDLLSLDVQLKLNKFAIYLKNIKFFASIF